MINTKYRAWDEDNKSFDYFDMFEEFDSNFWQEVAMFNQPLEQYTGQIDLNEKELFAGDLIQNESGRVCEIYFNEIVGCWDAKVIKCVRGDNSDGFEYCDFGSTTRIGNIHEGG